MTKKIWFYNERGRGKYALVSNRDYAEVARYAWSLSSDGYAISAFGSMHRMIMGYPDYRIVDHKSGDRLDNRRCNLRIATPAQNSYNRGTRPGRSGYRGVVVLPSGRFRAQVNFKGVLHLFGIFIDARDAALAYNDGARQLFGEFARLNDV